MLRLDTEARTFSQELVTSQAVMVCKAAPVKVSQNSGYDDLEVVMNNQSTKETDIKERSIRLY